MKKAVCFVAGVVFAAGCAERQEGQADTTKSPGAEIATDAPQPAADTTPPTYDGPFGLKAGLTLDEVRRVATLTASDVDGVYRSTDVPKPHPAFESYSLYFSTKSGLCAITSIGKDIEAGQTGSEVRTEFSGIEDGLTSKYGKGKRYDFATGLMDEMQYWMIALSDKNRTLATFWAPDSGSTLPADISSISLQAHALDMSTGYVNLRYEFSNIEDCSNERKDRQNSAL